MAIRTATQMDQRRVELLYVAAAVIALVGALANALGLLAPRAALAGAVATVNGEPVARSDYIRALSAMQSGLNRALTAADRERALDILISEELIVQHALKLDLARGDPLARRNLIQAVIALAGLPAQNADPQQDDLEAFFLSERALFAAPARLSLRAVYTTDETAAAQARRDLQAGAGFIAVASQNAMKEAEIPARVPLGKIADYAGGAVRDAAAVMATGDIAGPIGVGDRFYFLWMTERQGGDVAFEDVREQVEMEWRRREEERAFNAYVSQLRKRSRVRRLIDPLTDDGL